MQLNNKVTMKELVEGLHQALRPAYTEAPTLRHDFFSNELFGVILILNYQHKTLHSLFFDIINVLFHKTGLMPSSNQQPAELKEIKAAAKKSKISNMLKFKFK